MTQEQRVHAIETIKQYFECDMRYYINDIIELTIETKNNDVTVWYIGEMKTMYGTRGFDSRFPGKIEYR